MTYTVQWARKTVKQLDKLDRTAQKKIVLAVTKLADNPCHRSVKSLVNRPGEYCIRIGDYRVVYEIHCVVYEIHCVVYEIHDDRLLVLVIAVAHRREIYQTP